MTDLPSDPNRNHFDGWFPFNRQPNSDASMFIQWKDTDLCMGFICGICETQSHLDGDFAYFVGCPECAAVYQMGTQVAVKQVEDADEYHKVVWMER